MNSIQETREQLGLSRREFGHLLGGSEKYVAELESFSQSQLSPVHLSLSILLRKHGNAQDLVERRINALSPGSTERDALSALARKFLLS